MVELLENEVLVLKALRDSNGKSTLANLSKITELADSAIARSVLTLTNLGLVRETVARKTELACTDEGITSAWQGLPERRVVDVFPEGGGRMPIDLAVKQAGLDPKFTSIVTGWITRKEWGRIDRDESGVVLTVEKRPEKDDDERFLEKIEHHGLILEELPENLQSAAKRLLKRNILESRPRNERTIEITQTGLETIPSEYARGEVSSLTGDMIASGDWERVRLRSYNVSSPVPTVRPGKYHPYTRFLRQVKRKLLALGFQEVSGPLVEPAFINCDCLFMPQDHPAREIHDLYYLKEPEKTSLQDWGEVVDRVAKTHENGWKTGSTGWRYKYSKDEAAKLILRSHGTATSVRKLLSKDLLVPGKYFSIARCYRPEFLDRTHLTEFNQVEGIVVGKGLNLRNLLGILEMFAKQIAGAEKVRFKPDYFPFTEPSIELQAYKQGFGWLEFGGSGIFRPEVTEPLGIRVPVLAWGLGIDRLYMMHRGIQDIRQIFTPDLGWIREQKVD